MATDTVLGNPTDEGSEAILAALLASTAAWSGAKVHLYQSSFAPTRKSVAADFIAAEANFTGYAPIALTYSAIGVDADGNPTAVTNRAFFQASDAVTPNSIGGAWVQEDVTGPPATHQSVRYYQFPNPIPMATASAFIAVVIGVQDPDTPGYAIVDH